LVVHLVAALLFMVEVAVAVVIWHLVQLLVDRYMVQVEAVVALVWIVAMLLVLVVLVVIQTLSQLAVVEQVALMVVMVLQEQLVL
jgi:hypothetical protein